MQEPATKNSILIVEDDRNIASLVETYLGQAGFETAVAHDGRQGLELARRLKPSLVILDIMLPGLDGWDICRELRRGSEVPILILTAREEEVDRIVGFSLGADDYVVKPFSPRELVARVRALLRRSGATGAQPISAGGLTLDPATQRAGSGSRQVELSPTEFRLLEFMMRHPDHVLSRATLLDKVWGDHVFIEERTVDVHVRRLRVALGTLGRARLVQTVRGAGYRFALQ